MQHGNRKVLHASAHVTPCNVGVHDVMPNSHKTIEDMKRARTLLSKAEPFFLTRQVFFQTNYVEVSKNKGAEKRP